MTAPVGSLASQIEAQHQVDQTAIEAICSRPSNWLARTTFRTSRLLDFASEKELVAQTGHSDETPGRSSSSRSWSTTRSTPARKPASPPVITVTVDRSGITVEDNGPGIPADVVEDILDFSVRVSSREAYVSPTRGAQGNALKTIVAMPFVLDGDRGRVEIEAQGARHVIDFGVDRIRQQPTVEHRVETGDVTTGTRIKVDWPDSACSILEDAKAQFLQIAGQYAWLNPHLSITVDWFGERSTEAATDPAWSKWKPSDPTSPHWYTRRASRAPGRRLHRPRHRSRADAHRARAGGRVPRPARHGKAEGGARRDGPGARAADRARQRQGPRPRARSPACSRP